MEISEVIAGTLDWCNERRAEKNQEPLDDLPKGKRRSPLSCPCGAATGLWVSLDVYHEYTGTEPQIGDEGIGLPPAVRTFILKFDNGKLPQYEVPE